MVRRGIGQDQIKKAELSKQKILRALEDLKWHRYKDILDATNVSPTTLSKHLKELEKGIVERKLDLESKEYPTPVCYRIRPDSSKISMALTKQETLARRSLHITEDRRLDNYWREYIVETTANIMWLLYSSLLSEKHGNYDDSEHFDQALELIFVAGFRAHIQNAQVKLKELSGQGVDVLKLINDSASKINKDMRYLLKQGKIKKPSSLNVKR